MPDPATREFLSARLAEGWSLLARDPAGAAGTARAMLVAVPGLPDALLLLGRACAALDRPDEALEAYREATRRAPGAPQVWRALAEHLHLRGDVGGADAAYAGLIETSAREPRLGEAARLVKAGKLGEADALLRTFLRAHPHDVVALRMLATVMARGERFAEAEAVLRGVLERAPGYDDARLFLAELLVRGSRPAKAVAVLDGLPPGRDPGEAALTLKAAALGRVGEHGRAAECLEAILARDPADAGAWMRLGHVRKTLGRREEAVAAYRRAIDLRPTLGEAWWSLANLQSGALGAADRAAMERARADPGATATDRMHLDFAIGRAREEAGDDAAAFAHYLAGNHAKRAIVRYDPGAVEALVDRSIALFTPDFFAARAGWGSARRDPIFVLGMPRAGSTLIEQILASHPDIEGTHELPDLGAVALGLSRHVAGRDDRYPLQVAALDAATAAALGEAYLTGTDVQRKTGRPLFVDKMPTNWMHAGLIHLILPHATIIDARRHPIACCFSNFQQLYAQGNDFAYDLSELGRYHVAYERMMAHLGAVLPGRVLRVRHEDLVDDLEAEVRRMLGRIGVPFDPACLRFDRTERAVRTASAEQVRRPIFRDGVDRWRRFEPWLGPLTDALGPVPDMAPE
jgi:cytochrome c-type biogenesis protein CcmH/NrfG